VRPARLTPPAGARERAVNPRGFGGQRPPISFLPLTSGPIPSFTLKHSPSITAFTLSAAVFLFDEQGKMVGQATRWVIGGAKDKPGLAAGATNAFHFVIAAEKPFTTTNLTAKVNFNRVVLAGGKLADANKDVTVTTATK
jgi:hypothetical protein